MKGQPVLMVVAAVLSIACFLLLPPALFLPVHWPLLFLLPAIFILLIQRDMELVSPGMIPDNPSVGIRQRRKHCFSACREEVRTA